MRWWKSKPLSDEESEISEAIKSLRTLRVENGCVSISPSEVLEQPGYMQDRAEAGARVRARQRHIACDASWDALDELGIQAFSALVARRLFQARAEGLSLDAAITQLRDSLTHGDRT
ncbi:MAG TPA: hypothetical protein VF682_22285 [Pseudomonas sp.]|jgi:hypothetical protein